eukprot:10512891-Alexandrium_andersonii.AAC.1
MINCITRSELELQGPRSGLELGPRGSRAACSAQPFAHIPNLPTNRGIKRVCSRETAKAQAPNPDSSNP